MSTTHGYPRPQLERASWTSLNGAWQFAIDADAQWSQPAQVTFDSQIQVPFTAETPASGVGNTSFFKACWYRRSVDVPALDAGDRLILHFGAVDTEAAVWVDGQLVARHSGGYTPFAADITGIAAGKSTVDVVVQAQDDPHDLDKPRGKQDWQLEPHAIWYPRTTGIWQTVWLEQVPATAIAKLHWTPNVVDWSIALEAAVDGVARDDLRLRVRLSASGRVLADDIYRFERGALSRTISLADPGIDDLRRELLWSPEQPTLIQARVELQDASGTVLDRVRSYTAMRQVSVQGNRFLLNSRPIVLRLVLDQGYYAETGLSTPSDEALQRDIELAQAMGFNGVRKHQKIEDPRYLYWADVMGLLVWEEMPSAYGFSRTAVERVTKEWTAAIDRDRSHPCIVAWVPFNESWGVPDLPESEAQRNYTRALYHLTHTLDGTRPISTNDGWETPRSDIVGIHDYDSSPERLRERYRDQAIVPSMLQYERPAGRQLMLDAHPYEGQPLMLTEFGGIAFSDDPEKTWGYSRSADADAFSKQYTALLDVVRELRIFSGFCYTQFADTYQESNGLLYADRTPKIPLEQIANATRGPRTDRQLLMERRQRERFRRMQEQERAAEAED